MSSFKALVIEKTDDGQTVALKDFKVADLMDGDVTIKVTHSTLNYKDGLALTGKSPVVRRFPMIPGVDCAGIVEASDNPDFQAGDRVILNGWGTGETHLGSYAEKARVRGDWLIPLPKGLTPSQAMAVGTAGFTAMLSVLALERHGCNPGDGPAIVTGAAGGVGSMAIAFLAKAGWHVVASTGRVSETDYLSELGATEIIERSELSGPGRPLAKERWAVGVELGRLQHLGQSSFEHSIRRSRRCLRPCRWHGSANLCRSFHTAKCGTTRHRLGESKKVFATGSLGSDRP